MYRTLRGLVSFAIKRDNVKGLDPMRGIDNPRPYRPGPVNGANDAELVGPVQDAGKLRRVAVDAAEAGRGSRPDS